MSLWSSVVNVGVMQVESVEIGDPWQLLKKREIRASIVKIVRAMMLRYLV